MEKLDPREKEDSQPPPQPAPEPVVLPDTPYNPNWDTVEKSDDDWYGDRFPQRPRESD